MKALIAAVLAAAVAPAHAEPEQHPKVHRLVIETAGLFAVGQAWYYRHGRLTNSGDWELPMTWDTIGRKLTGDGFRFDADGFDTNGLNHPLFGLAGYMLGRENHLGVAGSFALSTLYSGLWETFGEWREYGSINDLLMTSTSGVPLGETLHQLIHHRGRYEVGAGVGRDLQVLSLRAEVDAERRVAFALQLPRDHAGLRGRQIEARAELLDGRAVTTFDYRLKWARPGETWDLAAFVGIGPTFGVRRSWIETGVDAEVVTGMIRPLAFSGWRTLHPDAFVRGSLEYNEHGYYHAVGIVLAPRIAVRAGRFVAGAQLRAGAYRALGGHDRYQSMITADPDLADEELAGSAWAGIEVGLATVHLEVMDRERAGRADDVRASARENTALLAAGVRL
jgi:hypothetical protein